ncbi:uncharacterized protein LOC107870607 [Capsicum annuum]|uniref:uncharacterized protein LOC107870607 n=1 Tax=Capsicum annuum TaxID=4072 RepID=UPI0007BFB5F0|nr:uncharacterized protein LOC107870607 [Capsicum annuum]
MNRYWHYREVVEDHIYDEGFVDGYTKWIFHEEGISSINTPYSINNDKCSNLHNDIDGLLYDTFINVDDNLGDEGAGEGLLDDAKKIFKLLEEGKKQLYQGSVEGGISLAQLPESFNKARKMEKCWSCLS